MKAIKLVFFLLFVLTITQVNCQNIRNFKLEDTHNKTLAYNDLKGEKLTVIDFWATWCKPCLKAIPSLIKIQEEFKSLGVNFIGISCDGPRSVSKVAPLTNTFNINYPILLDFNNDVMRDYNISNLPTLIIVNQENKIVYFHEGFNAGDEIEIKLKINELLGK